MKQKYYVELNRQEYSKAFCLLDRSPLCAVLWLTSTICESILRTICSHVISSDQIYTGLLVEETIFMAI